LISGAYQWSEQHNEKLLLKKRKNLNSEIARIKANLEQALNVDAALIRATGAYIAVHPDISQADFDVFCERLLKNKSQINNIAAAPEGVVRYTYPYWENRKAIGLNLLKYEEQKASAIQASKSGNIVIGGPIRLIQGWDAFIGRLAVETQTANGKDKKFWGLISAPISIDKVWKNTGFFELANTYRIAMRGKDAKGAGGEVFFGEESIFSKPDHKATVQLPAGSWQIAAKFHPRQLQKVVPWGPWLSTWGIGILLFLLIYAVDKARRDQDIYEKTLILAKEKAEQGEKTKSEFLASMSHEIRTPMNGIIGLTDLLMSENLNDDVKKGLSTIKNSGRSLMIILNDILDLSKINAGKMNLEATPFNLENTLIDLERIFNHSAQNKGLHLNIHPITYESEITKTQWTGAILGDVYRFNQILSNLINNAIKFTEKGGVDVHTKILDTDEVLISVMDTGIGITPEQQKNLFQDFNQADQSITRKFGGTGLGLAISKKLTQLMKGKISVSSETDKGSTFNIYIPIHTKDIKFKATTKEKPQTLNVDLSHTKILLVEDNPVNVKVMQKMITKLNGHCDIATDGRDAVDMALKKPYELILMDIQLPHMNGIDASELILKDHTHNNTPYIIAITANVDLEYRERCTEIGMQDFASKPITFTNFKAHLQKFFESQEQS
jgi:signal transduction histidine kinase/CheY-like chemotaxis protein